MDLPYCSDIKRESNNMVFKKEEEFFDECSLNYACDVKEEVASICDDEQGFDREVPTVQEDNKLSLGLGFNYSTIIEQPVQDGHNSLERDVQNKRKKKNPSNLKFNEEVNFLQHGRVSRDKIFKCQEYYCNLCLKLYHGRKCFKDHFKDHFMPFENRYKCLICYYSASNVGHINRHLLQKHFLRDEKNKKERLFPCTICELRFYEKKDLERHTYVHTRKGHMKCAECDFTFTNKNRLRTHLSLFHGYPRIAGPKSNKASSKDDEGLFECYHCGYCSESKSVLRIHIERHVGYKGFKCPDCNYECTAKGDLQKHRTIHSAERPFVCNECSKTFKRRSHLLIHFNRKYSCRQGTRKNKQNPTN